MMFLRFFFFPWHAFFSISFFFDATLSLLEFPHSNHHFLCVFYVKIVLWHHFDTKKTLKIDQNRPKSDVLRFFSRHAEILDKKKNLSLLEFLPSTPHF
jgi:hypothetical protein